MNKEIPIPTGKGHVRAMYFDDSKKELILTLAGYGYHVLFVDMSHVSLPRSRFVTLQESVAYLQLIGPYILQTTTGQDDRIDYDIRCSISDASHKQENEQWYHLAPRYCPKGTFLGGHLLLSQQAPLYSGGFEEGQAVIYDIHHIIRISGNTKENDIGLAPVKLNAFDGRSNAIKQRFNINLRTTTTEVPSTTTTSTTTAIPNAFDSMNANVHVVPETTTTSTTTAEPTHSNPVNVQDNISNENNIEASPRIENNQNSSSMRQSISLISLGILALVVLRNDL